MTSGARASHSPSFSFRHTSVAWILLRSVGFGALFATMSGVSESQPRLVLENFIGGKFVACKSHIDSYNPSTGEVYCSVPDSGPEEVGQDCLALVGNFF